MFQIKNQQIFISRFVFLISILSSFAFGIAGITKIIGVEMMHDSFVKMNLPYWFGYFIGVSELAGSIGIQLKKSGMDSRGPEVKKSGIPLKRVEFHSFRVCGH